MFSQNQGFGLSDVQSVDTVEKGEEFRQKGNELFKAGRYFGALAQYNKALLLSRHDKTRSSLCYANRSAVYLELKYFKHCLHNIDLAEPCYPPNKIQKLHERCQKCLNKMKLGKDLALQPFKHDYKLSYEPNPKIPFFINAIETRINSKYGKHLITTIDLIAGDVIAVIDNTFKTPINDITANYVQGCYTCWNPNNGDLIPGKCRALFCSDKCRDEHELNESDHEFIHEVEMLYIVEPDDVERGKKFNTDFLIIFRILMKLYDAFGSIDEMRKFVDSHRNKLNYHLFDFDWSLKVNDPEYQKNMLLLIMSQKAETFKDDKEMVTYHSQTRLTGFRQHLDILSQLKKKGRILEIFEDPNQKNQKFLDNLVKQIYMSASIKFLSSMIKEPKHPLGLFSFPTMTLLSRSCDPNITFNSGNAKKTIWNVRKPIKAGEQLFVGNNGVYYEAENGGCSGRNEPRCHACVNGWKRDVNFKKIDDDSTKGILNFGLNNDVTKLSNWLNYKDKTCDFINQNFDGYYKDKKIRQMIVAKFDELDEIIERIEEPFPPVSEAFYPHYTQTSYSGLSKHTNSLVM